MINDGPIRDIITCDKMQHHNNNQSCAAILKMVKEEGYRRRKRKKKAYCKNYNYGHSQKLFHQIK